MEAISIHPIAGIPQPLNQLRLTNRSRLRIRLPIDQIPLVYPLAGQTITIDWGIERVSHQAKFQLGIPYPTALQPASTLYSRLVLIHRAETPEAVLEVAQRQLNRKGIKGTIELPTRANGEVQCRLLTIKKKHQLFRLRGFGMKVTKLSEKDSIKLQQSGIGGKHKMMCGVFVPTWRETTEKDENSNVLVIYSGR
ncbi:type I-MYXAN CRISPR-associated protein Cas6/Cmx6 [Gloeothece verrucosa]|uniref:type I-MYXAN CRISPR-associated protein Cas6/Cmx6 n=1 Tax=Gloeothece verrucosa TaxID=2546359 RepID=UPI000311A779|nr:type I-MYXAN CRISPR-associated protein Cas6/Cmx6 [Gloeothece verrucosa]